MLVPTLVAFACSPRPETSARDAADANDTGRVIAPSSESERALIQQLATLPSGVKRTVGDAVVTADAPYEAASGRTCRQVSISSPRKRMRRLACSDGKAWFFVPDVFAGNTGE
jgi:hypothetical protein